jgi:hypothetical protein
MRISSIRPSGTQRRPWEPRFPLPVTLWQGGWPQEWNSGERVWIVDIVAPAALKEMLIAKVKAELFERREVKVRKGYEVVEADNRSGNSKNDETLKV